MERGKADHRDACSAEAGSIRHRCFTRALRIARQPPRHARSAASTAPAAPRGTWRTAIPSATASLPRHRPSRHTNDKRSANRHHAHWRDLSVIFQIPRCAMADTASVDVTAERSPSDLIVIPNLIRDHATSLCPSKKRDSGSGPERRENERQADRKPRPSASRAQPQHRALA